jgi:hypothetical protein
VGGVYVPPFNASNNPPDALNETVEMLERKGGDLVYTPPELNKIAQENGKKKSKTGIKTQSKNQTPE